MNKIIYLGTIPFMMKVVVGILCYFSFLSGSETVQDPVTGLAFPTEVTIDYQGKHYNLQATGVASLKMMGFKIYAISHYMQKGVARNGDPFQQIAQEDAAKQLTLKYLMGASASRVQKGIDDAFRNTLDPSTYSQLSEAIRYYISLFNLPLKKGDEQIIRWLPGGQIQLILNGQEAGSFTHYPFAQALWNLWFGPKSSVDRNQLISFFQ